MKRVLVLTTFYPPAGGIAPTRIASFVRHLPAAGWEPAVVTVDWHEGNRMWIDESQNDPSLQEKVIFRSPQPDLRRRPGSKIPPLLRWASLRVDALAVLQQIGDRFRYGEPAIGSRFFVRAARRFLKSHLGTERYDAILATSPDLNPQIIARDAGHRFGIPWVADCRDDYAVFREGKPAYVRVERELLETAAAVVTVSKGLASEIGKRVGRELVVVENGFEPKSKATATLAESSPFERDTLNLVYTGSVSMYYPDRHDPDLVFAAADLFLERCPEAEGRFAIHFFGDTALQPVLDEFSSKYPRLRGVLRDRGRVERSEALAAQRAADLLLILAHPGRRGILTGKVFEYLAAQRPILCVPGDEDELDELLLRTRAGEALRTVEEGASRLEEWFREWDREGSVSYECAEDEVDQYGRDRLTGKLAKVLDSVSSG